MVFEIMILIIQLITFYLFPLLAGPTDAIGMVMIIIFVTFFLSLIMGVRGKSKWRFLYPLVTSVIFIPSVFIYYNVSALIHAQWYLVISAVGLGIGALIGKLVK